MKAENFNFNTTETPSTTDSGHHISPDFTPEERPAITSMEELTRNYQDNAFNNPLEYIQAMKDKATAENAKLIAEKAGAAWAAVGGLFG